jgi:hypothetical protein
MYIMKYKSVLRGILLIRILLEHKHIKIDDWIGSIYIL